MCPFTPTLEVRRFVRIACKPSGPGRGDYTPLFKALSCEKGTNLRIRHLHELQATVDGIHSVGLCSKERGQHIELRVVARLIRR